MGETILSRKVDKKGGNGDVVFNYEANTARKYLRNTSSKEKIKRFSRELEVLRNVQSSPIPNVVQIINVNIDEKEISESYIEMKKYDGTLDDLLYLTKGNVKLTLELILPIIRALYSLSINTPPIFHRDIKPNNILYEKINNSYVLYLTDFGTCFLDDNSERITPENIAVGPRNFIAPEYEIGKVDKITEKGDIFSIGKVIWFMINGTQDDYMPSNFWFVQDFNLLNRFQNNQDMIVANNIIASCLNINPEERCDYLTLIKLIENYIDSEDDTFKADLHYKIKLYQEKRKMELLEINQKNKHLINIFSCYYISVLKEFITVYPEFDLFKVFYDEYQKKSKGENDYTSINVDNNSAHYLYSRSYDRIYYSINYVPAGNSEKYCHITIKYLIKDKGLNRDIKIFYSNGKIIVTQIDNSNDLLTVQTVKKILITLLEDYIS